MSPAIRFRRLIPSVVSFLPFFDSMEMNPAFWSCCNGSRIADPPATLECSTCVPCRRRPPNSTRKRAIPTGPWRYSFLSSEAHRVYHQSGFAGGLSLCDPVFAVNAQLGGETSPMFSFRNFDSLSISTSEGTSNGVGILIFHPGKC